MAAAATYSTAVLGGARLATAGSVSPRSLLLLPRRSVCSSSSPPPPPPPSLVSASHFQDAQRFTLLRVKATSEDTSTSSDELLADLKAKWDAIDNKSTVFLYGGGAIVAVWLSSVVVGAINSVPLLPKVMELVGLGYTAWFVYRYLLFKESRKELASDIEELKKKIAGTSE